MRIVVLGASGRTGREVVTQAVAEGHEVVAVARAGSDVPAGAMVVRAGFDDADALEEAVRGADAVISALGGRGRGPTTVCTDGVSAVLAAMERTQVRRLVVVSAAGLPGEGDDLAVRWLVKPILQRVFRHPYADMARMEEIVRASDRDWTIVRPPQLTDGPRTGSYRRALDRHLAGGHRVARADLAAELLRLTREGDAVGHLVAVAD
ncbi:putative NADH-flavin reductase [Actinomycetospora succinea]|uniref:Putative NADH-flavin reductase n=1 Tax=Actinomycetospora succinea TaxID=663603 RepID=A0A4R6VLD3_9PSEU|nr:NAD(P)H-binding protein [Actinomycetospora succinea]TDQ62691.1 putative NADH-flavin reductase [Actinomycetospora succinea]